MVIRLDINCYILIIIIVDRYDISLEDCRSIVYFDHDLDLVLKGYSPFARQNFGPFLRTCNCKHEEQ